MTPQEYVSKVITFSDRASWEMEVLSVLDWANVCGVYALDYGSGSGKLCSILKRHYDFQYVCGVDINTGLLAYARKTYPAFTFTNPIALLSSPMTYDMVTMFHVLGRVPNPITTLQMIRNVLVDRGRLLIVIPNKVYDTLMVPYNTVTGYKGDPTICHSWTRREAMKLLRACGFIDLEYTYFGEPVKGFPDIPCLRSRIAIHGVVDER